MGGRGRGLGGNPRNWSGDVDLYTAVVDWVFETSRLFPALS